MRWPAQARVGIWDGHTRYRRPSATSLHNREASTISVLTGRGHGVRLKREEDAATSLGRVIGSNVRLAPTSLTLSSPRTEAGMTMKMTMGLTKGQMSDSLGAAPLAQFAPASLTSTPPEADAGVEAAEMVLGGSQQPGKKRRRKGRTRITRKQIAAKRARSEDHEAPGS